MTRILSVGAALAVLACIGTTALATAQPTIDMNILSNGKPAADVTISAIISGGKQVVATTGSSGRITLDTRLLNIGKGTEVAVWIKTCEDGEVEVILVPEGEEGDCVEQGAEVGEACGCRRAGIILWGEGPVTIDVGTGTVTQAPTAVGTVSSVDHAFADIQFGVTADYSSFYNWEDVGCDQAGIASCSGDTGVPGVGVYLDYRLGDSPFGLNFEAHYAKLELDQAFQPDDDLPIGNTAEVNSWQFQSALVYSHGFSSRIAWFGRLGYAVLHNDGEFTSTYSTGPLSESRSNTASQLLVGTGMHFPVGENWCVRAGVDLTTSFDSGNGDENVRASLGVGYRLNRE